jgi:Transposase
MPGWTFTHEFKLVVVRQLAMGETRPAHVCREHGLVDSVLACWRAGAKSTPRAARPRSRTCARCSMRPVRRGKRWASVGICEKTLYTHLLAGASFPCASAPGGVFPWRRWRRTVHSRWPRGPSSVSAQA